MSDEKITPDSVKSPPKGSADVISTACQYCVVGCGYEAHLWEEGQGVDTQPNLEQAHWVSPAMTERVLFNGKPRIVAVTPDPKCPMNKGNHSVRGGTMGRDLVAVESDEKQKKNDSVEERIKDPWLRTDKGWIELTNEEADEIAAELVLQATEAELKGNRMHFTKPEALGVKMFEYGSLENTYVGTKFFQRLINTPNIAFHDRASLASNTQGFNDSGIDPHGYAYVDVWDSDIIFLIGSNPYENQSVFFMQQMTGKRIIVLDPRRTITADYAVKTGGIHLQPERLGADVAVINALCKYILKQRQEHPEPAEPADDSYDHWGRKRYSKIQDLVKESIDHDYEFNKDDGPGKGRKARNQMTYVEYETFLKGQPTLSEAAKLSGIPLNDLKETARLLSGPMPEVKGEDELSKRYKNPDTRKVSIIFEKGIIWGYNYHGTAAVANLGLLLGSVLRPENHSSLRADAIDPQAQSDSNKDPAPLGVTGRAGGHQKGWASARYKVKKNGEELNDPVSYPFFNSKDYFDDGKYQIPTHHYFDAHLVGGGKAERHKWSHIEKTENEQSKTEKPDINLLWVIGANPCGQMADAAVKWKAVSDRKSKKLPTWDTGMSKADNISLVIEFYKEMLANNKLVVIQQDIYANATTNYADLVLPAKGWGEHSFTRYTGERRLRLYGQFQDAPSEQCRVDWEIFASIARKLFETETQINGVLQNFKDATHADGLPEGKDADGLPFGYSMSEELGKDGFKWGDALNDDQIELEERHRLLSEQSELIFKELSAGIGQVPGKGSNRNKPKSLQPVGALDEPYKYLKKQKTNGFMFPNEVIDETKGPDWVQPSPRVIPPLKNKDGSNPYSFVACDWKDICHYFGANQGRCNEDDAVDEHEFEICNGRINELWNSMFTHIRNETIRSRYPNDMPGSIIEMNQQDATKLGLENGDIIEVYRAEGRSFKGVTIIQDSNLIGDSSPIKCGVVFAYFSFPVSEKMKPEVVENSNLENGGPFAGRSFKQDGYVNNVTSHYMDPINPIAAVKYARGKISAVKLSEGGLKLNYFSHIRNDAEIGPSMEYRHIAFPQIPKVLVKEGGIDERLRVPWKCRELIVQIGLPREGVDQHRVQTKPKFLNPDEAYTMLEKIPSKLLRRMRWRKDETPLYDEWKYCEIRLSKNFG